MADRDLGFNITALDNASKTFVKLASQVDRLSERLDRLDHKKVDVTVDVDAKKANAELSKLEAQSGKTGALVSAVAAGVTAIGPAGVVAAAGIGALAGFAVPSLKKIVEAQKNLDAHWNDLNGSQQVVAKNLHGLIDEYKALAASVEPQTLTAANAALNTTRTLLPKLTPIAGNAANAFTELSNESRQALNGPYWSSFFSFLSQQAEPTLNDFGDLLGSTAHLLAAVTQNVLPLSQALLKLASGGINAVASFVDANPLLTEFGLAALSARAPLKGFGKLLRGTAAGARGVGTDAALAAGGLTAVGAKAGKAVRGVQDFAAATKGGTIAEKVNLATTTALGGVFGGTVAPVVATTAAIGGFSYAMYKLTTVSTTLSGSVLSNTRDIIKQAGSYQQASAAISQQYVKAQHAAKTANTVASASGRESSLQVAALKNQYSRTAAVVKTQFGTSLDHVSQILGITLPQAYVAAKNRNIDLTNGFTGNSKAAQDNRNKLAALAQQMRLTNTPALRINADWKQINDKSLTMKQRLQAVQDAFFNLNGALNADQATIAFNNDMKSLTDSLKQNGMSFDLDTVKGRANSQALIQSAQTAEQNYNARIKQGLGVGVATRAMEADRLSAYRNMLQMGLTKAEAQRLTDKYYKIPGEVNTSVGTPGMAQAQTEIDRLHKKVNDLQNKNIAINATGAWRTARAGAGTTPGSFYATGGPILGPGTGTSDSVVARVSHNEHVWTAEEVHAAGGHGAVEAMRRNVLSNAPRFAQGGAVNRSISAATASPGVHPIPGQINSWLNSAITAWAKKLAATFMSTSGDSGARSASAAVAQAYAAQAIGRYGWGPGQMGPLIKLWNQESGWNAYAVNPSSGAYGIPQSLGHGHPYALGDYATQVNWGANYIAGRYGSPAAAWAHEQAFNWYGNGLKGAVFDKPTLIGVGESGPERVDVTPMRGGGGSSEPQVVINVYPQPGQSETEIASMVQRRLSLAVRG